MKIIKEENQYHQFAFEYTFNIETLNFCRWLKNTEGWKNFGFLDKKWRFSDPKLIHLIKERYPTVEIDSTVQDVFNQWIKEQKNEQQQVTEIEVIKNKTSSNLVVEGIKGTPYPFQLVGIEFLIKSKGRAIINSDIGTGKTCQALGYIIHQKIEKSLIITMASIKWSFEGEVRKWTNLKPFVINSQTDFTKEIFDEHNVFIINYDILRKFFPILSSLPWQILVLDEVQKIKSLNAIRSKVAKQLARKIPKIIMLTGTLLLSRPAELFNPLNILDPYVWNNWYYFTKKYCFGHDTRWGYDFSGASNIEELRNRISKYYIRHTKEEVLKDLPEKMFIDVPIELDNASRSTYNFVFDSLVDYLHQIKKKNAIEIQRSLQAEKLVKLNELRQITTNSKIQTAVELIENILEEDKKIIIFSSYNAPLKTLLDKFHKQAVILIGETPELARKEAIDNFQNNNQIKIFLCGFGSGGVGITLTAASNIIFLDMPWCPADMSQAYGRAHRIGNKADHINIYQIFARDTIDSDMRELINQKQLIFDQLFNKQEEQQPGLPINLMDDLLKKYEQ